MKSITLGFTGQEALKMVQEYYPKSWEQKIIEKVTIINLVAEAYKTTPEIAFSKLLSKNTDMAITIELIATNYFLQLDKKLKEVEDLKAKQLQIGNQLVALESNIFISFNDKKGLRSYYLTLQNDLQIQISKIIDTEISQNEKL